MRLRPTVPLSRRILSIVAAAGAAAGLTLAATFYAGQAAAAARPPAQSLPAPNLSAPATGS